MIGIHFLFMKYLLFFFCLFTFTLSLKADHYLGANISYKNLGNRTLEVTVSTYENEQMADSDKPSIVFYWGDDQHEAVSRVNGAGNGVLINPNIRKSIYKGTHTYSYDGNFRIFVSEAYRSGSILNLNNGNSSNVKLYVDALAPVYWDAGICTNNSVEYQLDPIFYAEKNLPYSVNPGAYDSDGDSLVYILQNCRMENGATATKYTLPINTSVDATTGTLTWLTPGTGSHSFCLVINEYRSGKIIGSSSTDFVVKTSTNFTVNPTFPTLPHFQVIPGSTLKYGINISLSTVSSQSYSFWTSALAANNNPVSTANDVTDTVTWNTTINDAKKGAYVMVHRYQAILNGNYLQKDYAVAVHLYGDKTVNCTVPELTEVEIVTPEIGLYNVAPNVSSDLFWINIGTVDGKKLYLYDEQGRLIELYSNFTTETVKLDLSSLGAAMYFLVIYENDKKIIVKKIIKI